MDLLEEFYKLVEDEFGNDVPDLDIDSLINALTHKSKGKKGKTHRVDSTTHPAASHSSELQSPRLQDPTPMVGNPIDQESDDLEHPVVQQRNQVDAARKQGIPTEDAHQQVFGGVNTADINSKADFARTLGRVQKNSSKNAVYPDKNGQSIFAKEVELETSVDQVTPEDLKTPMDQEIPDELQREETDTLPLDYIEEMDYNEDIDYLKTYGRL